MTVKPPVYRCEIADCDVTDKGALEAFRAKRLEWLNWLEGDEVHAIGPQLSTALWNDAAFRIFGEIAKNNPDSALHNSLITEALVHGHFSGQVLTIRRLCDDRDDVISLRRLIDDVKRHSHLLTREIYVAYDGLPYDYEVAKEKSFQSLVAAGGGPTWVDTHGIHGFSIAEFRHETFDMLCELNGAQRDRFDRISPNILENIDRRIKESGANAVVKWSHKMLAHAADADSRGNMPLEKYAPNLGKLEVVLRSLVVASEIIGNRILTATGNVGGIPVPQFNPFEKLEFGVLPSSETGSLYDLWHKLSDERKSWVQNAWDSFTKTLAQTPTKKEQR